MNLNLSQLHWPKLRRVVLKAASTVAVLFAMPVSASLVSWDVDPAVSYLRLTIPDQTMNVTNVGNITVRMRDANSSTQWTDAGGRRAALDGVMFTDYTDATAITFLSGSNSVFALETTSLRPNPADWSDATTNYAGTTTALAALGGRVRGTYILTFDVAYAAFRSVVFDVTNAVPEPISITNGAFANNTTLCGISTALADVDGLELPLGLGQPVPDVFHGQMSPMMEANLGGGTVTNLGGLNRKLTYTINIPNLSLDLSGTIVTGSVAGLVVAYAVLPTPPSPPTLTVQRLAGAVVLAWSTNATGYSLEYTTNLRSTNWVPATPLPVVSNGQNVVTNATTSAAAFYRLRKP